jgi:hypothetical protein
MLLGDIKVTSTNDAMLHVIAGRYVLSGDTLIIFQLDSKVIELLKNDLYGKINGIVIIHIQTESSLSQFKQDLTDLLKYIIFYQQNDIVYDNFNVISRNERFNNATKEVVQANQHKITKNDYALFPVERKSCFCKDLTGYHFVLNDPNDNQQSYFGKEAVLTTEREEIMMPPGVDVTTTEPYMSDGTYYEKVIPEGGDSSDGGEGAAEIIQYKRVWIHETYTIEITGFRSSSMGIFTSAVSNSSDKLIITRKMRPDEYLKPQD